MIGFGDAVGRYYKNYFKFSGRASRAEYWWPVLMQLIVYFALIVAFVMMAGFESGSGSGDMSGGAAALLIGGVLVLLLNVIPGYAVAARRFHDLDQTGWLVLVFVLANAIVGVSVFAQLIWFSLRGTDGPNQYGPDPYAYDADVFG